MSAENSMSAPPIAAVAGVKFSMRNDIREDNFSYLYNLIYKIGNYREMHTDLSCSGNCRSTSVKTACNRREPVPGFDICLMHGVARIFDYGGCWLVLFS